ncbi:MAG: hypothetical protein IZT58_13535 [Actinobacteria bacterium]|nr:hypothetical protein [Actinomycetota bacterium]
METNHQLNAPANDNRTERLAPTGRRFVRAVAVAVLLAVGAPTMATAGEEDRSAAPTVEASADMSSSQLAAPLAPASSHRGGQPDRVADYVGGIAARVHSDDGERIPGDLFLLMALAGSDTDARLYDHTPYLLDSDQTHPETIESNQQAVRTIEAITDTDLQMVNFTSAPGGGPSAGITYAIAYLNIISDGAFTGDLVVAATGSLEPHGYVHPINAINEKTAAARLAGADVLFTPSFPAAELLAVHGTRIVGELSRARNTGSTLTNERQWDNYHRWGMNRPNNEMDIVGIRHIGDVATYLCGAGSDYACNINLLLENVVTDTSETTQENTPHSGPRSAVHTDVPAQLS